MVNYDELSKEVSYALRHAPEKYGLFLDSGGWVEVDKLLHSLQKERKWMTLEASDIVRMIELSRKKRHEIKDEMIRAFYGHSTKVKIIKEVLEPPVELFHGTVRKFIDSIFNDGLIPKDRQYVHLSVDKATAIIVGKRRDNEPVILRIKAKEAYKNGVMFYIGHDDIWLSDPIPSKYIERV